MRESAKQRLRDDSGFTLSEMLVVVGLLGAVIAAAWGGMASINTSNEIASSEGSASMAMGDPLEQMSKVLMQNTSIRTTADNRLEAWTDRNLDGLPELNAFYVTNDGRLIYEWWLYNTARTAFTQHRTYVMAEHATNVTEGRPLFTYINASGAELVGSQVAQKGPSESVYVRVRLCVDINGRPVNDVREIAFRTRS